MIFIHEKGANSILSKTGLKFLVAVTPSIYVNKLVLDNCKISGKADPSETERTFHLR